MSAKGSKSAIDTERGNEDAINYIEPLHDDVQLEKANNTTLMSQNGPVNAITQEQKTTEEEDRSDRIVAFFCWTVPERRKKIIQTVILYFGFFALGLSMAITGPSLLDLQIITDSTTDDIAYVFTSGSVGGLIGGILCSILLGHFNTWVILGYALTVTGVLGMSLPHYSNLHAMIFVHFIVGIHTAMYDAGGNVALLKIWRKDHGPWMQALHCIFGLGSLLGPLIAEPFLFEKVEEVQDQLNTTKEMDSEAILHTSNSTVNNSLEGITTSEPQTNIMYAYIVMGIIVCAAALTLFMVFIANPNKQCRINKKEEKEEEEKEEHVNPDKSSFRVFILVGMFMFYSCYCIVEGNYGNFLMSYAVEGLGFSKTLGAAVTSFFWLSFTFGRFSGIFLIKYISPQILLAVDIVISVIALLPLLLFAHHHVSVVWVSSGILGLTMSTIFATGISWTERYIKLSGSTGAIFLVASSVGAIIGPILLSLLYKTYNIEAFVYIMFATTCIELVIFIFIQSVAYKHGERYIDKGDNVNNVQTENIDDTEMENMLRNHQGKVLNEEQNTEAAVVSL